VSKGNWFCITTLHDWLKKLAPLFHLIRSKTKTNRDLLAHVFPRFASATCILLSFDWFTGSSVSFCYWLEWLFWFWFHDTQMKTALYTNTQSTCLSIKQSLMIRQCCFNDHENIFIIEMSISIRCFVSAAITYFLKLIRTSNTYTVSRRSRSPTSQITVLPIIIRLLSMPSQC